MADTHDNGPGYGLLGETTYLPSDNTWTHSRSPDSGSKYEALGAALNVIPPPQQPTLGHGKDASAFGSDLAHLSDLIAEYDPVSREVASLPPTHDPLAGDLLAFGLVRDARREQTRQVAAFVSDSGRRQLTLTGVQLQRQGWKGDRATFIRVPQFDGDRGTWQSPSPIWQVAFLGEPALKLGFLAVRTAHGTYLLRIRLENHAEGRLDGSFSRFKITVKHSALADGNRFATHAHVSLNTSRPGQFAVVDVAGRWKVVDRGTDGAQEETKSALMQVSHALRDVGAEIDFADDGWARCVWLGERNFLLVCTRKALKLVNCDTDIAESVHINKAGTESLLFLDVRLDPCSQDRVFILTSTHVYLAHLQARFRADGKDASNFRVLAKIRHFRDSADISLKMSVSRQQNTSIVALFSGTTSTVSTIGFHDRDSSTVSVSVPQAMPLSLAKSSLPIACLHAQAVAWSNNDGDADAETTAAMYKQAGIHFVALFILHVDFSISQQLLATRPQGVLRMEPLTYSDWAARMKSTPAHAGSDFVVDDEFIEWDDEMEAAAHVRLERRARKPHKRNWTLQVLTEDLASVRADSAEDLTSVVSRIVDSVQNHHADSSTGINILDSFLNAALTVSDLDESHEALNALLHSEHPAALPGEPEHASVVPVASPRFLKLLGGSEFPDLHSIYDAIRALYLDTLTEAIPARTRRAREQLARRTAASHILSSHAIRRPAPATLDLDPIAAAQSRLSALAISPLQPQPALSATASSTLSQWSGDPISYNFATARELTLSQRVAANLTDTERARAEKDAARRRRQQASQDRRRTQQSSQVLQPEIAQRSAGPESQSELFQNVPSSQLFSSQVHGGSQPPRKKVKVSKKRMSGF